MNLTRDKDVLMKTRASHLENGTVVKVDGKTLRLDGSKSVKELLLAKQKRAASRSDMAEQLGKFAKYGAWLATATVTFNVGAMALGASTGLGDSGELSASASSALSYLAAGFVGHRLAKMVTDRYNDKAESYREMELTNREVTTTKKQNKEEVQLGLRPSF